MQLNDAVSFVNTITSNTQFEKSVAVPIVKIIPFEEALKEVNARHSVHCCIWGPPDAPSVGVDGKNTLEKRATVLMHMRFDGNLGFHGGMLDETVDDLTPEVAKSKLLEGLHRELEEELNFDIEKHKISVKEYLYSTTGVQKNRVFVYHFFAYKVCSSEDLLEIERRSIESKEHGRENFGNIRVPLYTASNNRGFPVFLCQRFIGGAVTNLLVFLLCNGIMTSQELEIAFWCYHNKRRS